MNSQNNVEVYLRYIPSACHSTRNLGRCIGGRVKSRRPHARGHAGLQRFAVEIRNPKVKKMPESLSPELP